MEYTTYTGPMTRSKSQEINEINQGHSYLHKVKQNNKRDQYNTKIPASRKGKSKGDKHEGVKSKRNANTSQDITKPSRQRDERKSGNIKKVRLVKRPTNVPKIQHAKSTGFANTSFVEEAQNGSLSKEIDHSKSTGSGGSMFQIREIASFQGQFRNANSICPISHEKAWISLDYDKIIYLFNTNGEIEKTLQMPGYVDDITIRPDGSLLVTHLDDGKVWIVDNTYSKVSELEGFNIEPLSYRGIHWTENGIYICCVECRDAGRGKRSERFIVKFAENGKLLEKYDEITENEKWGSPYKISSNINGDILVVDLYKSELIILDAIGKEKTRYTGQDKYSTIYGVCSNSEGFIFVSDHKKQQIDILYEDGSFCQTFGIEGCNPNPVALDKAGHLWVGCLQSPAVKVFDLLRP